MGVDELAVMVDFAGEVRVVFLGRLEDDLGLLEMRRGRGARERTLEPLVSL